MISGSTSLWAICSIPKFGARSAMYGDPIDNCVLALYADASYAGDLNKSKSTSGAFLAIVGPKNLCSLRLVLQKADGEFNIVV